jgi:hypothetical protein
MSDTQRCHLRGIHHAAAAESDHRLRSAGFDAGRDRIHHFDWRLRRNPGERLRAQRHGDLPQQTRARHPDIAYDEDAAPAIGLAYRREGLTSSASGDYPAREMILEGGQGGVHLLLGF